MLQFQLQRIRNYQEGIAQTVNRNIRQSRASRDDSGFAAFSQAADQVKINNRANARALALKKESKSFDTAIRRQNYLREQGIKTLDRQQNTQKRVADSWIKALNQMEGIESQFHKRRMSRLAEFDRRQAASAKATRDSFNKLAGGVASRGKAALGGGLIGAGFPALFGASAGEIAGGGVGGVLGGLLGGQSGAFTGSIFGSALGKLADFESQIKEITAQLGFSNAQAEQTAKAFKLAGVNGVDNFNSVLTTLQSTGLALKDQVSVIRAATAVTETYGGDITKTVSSLTEVFNKGKVGVADLNRLQRQGVPIQQALADKLGVTRNELLTLASDGKIKVQDLADAFIEVANKAQDAPKKGKTEFDKLKNSLLDAATAVKDLATELLKTLGPVISALAEDVARLAGALGDLLRVGPIGNLQRELTGGKILQLATFGATPDTVKGIAKELKNVSAEGIKTAEALSQVELIYARTSKRAGEFTGKAGELSQKIIQPELSRLGIELIQARKRVGTTPTTAIGRITPPTQFTPSDPKGRGGRTQDDTKQAKELLIQLQRRQAILKTTTELEKTLFNIQKEREDVAQKIADFSNISPQLREQLTLENERAVSAERTAAALTDALSKTGSLVTAFKPITEEQELLQAKINGTEKELLIQRQIDEILRGRPLLSREAVEQEVRKTEQLKEQNAALEYQKQILNSVVNQVGTQLTGLFENLIFQTEDWTKSLNNALKSLASLLIKAGLSALGGDDGAGVFSILSGNFGKRAMGGPVAGGTPYMVGERGPELFVPRSSGTIVPNNALGGGSSNVVVNVDATGSKVSGDNDQASQLGRVIGAAVQAELVKQKRPGGLLAQT